MPDPFDAGTPREAGVHLHWAMPDALLRGSFRAGRRRRREPPRAAAAARPLGGAAHRAAARRHRCRHHRLGARGRSRRGRAAGAVDRRRQRVRTAPRRPARRSTREQLTGTVGGAVSWSGVYDAVLNRFAFHDPLADLADARAAGRRRGLRRLRGGRLVERPGARPAGRGAQQRQPARAARPPALAAALRMGRRAASGAAAGAAQAELRQRARPDHAPTAGRAAAAGAKPAARAPPRRRSAVRADRQDLRRRSRSHVAASAFASEAVDRYVAPPWQLRSSLLHGAIYGVPVSGAPSRRPAAGRRRRWRSRSACTTTTCSPRFAAAAGARRTSAAPPSGCSRRSPRRRSTASARPTALVELEEHEHAVGLRVAARAARPAPTAILQRVQTGGVGGLGHRPASAAGDRSALERRRRRDAPRRAAAAARRRCRALQAELLVRDRAASRRW